MNDPRVLLTHAIIERREDDCFVVAAPDAKLAVNQEPASLARLRPDDRLAVGPYDIAVEAPPPGKDLALAVELTRPLGNAYDELVMRSRTEFISIGLGKRGWSWLLIVAMAVGFLGLPLVSALAPFGERNAVGPAAPMGRPTPPQGIASWLANADHLWLSGDVSGPHRYFAADCGACHRHPFIQVQNEACLECHRAIEQHADPTRFKFASLEAVACQSCHKEHNGMEPILLADQALCVGCHANLEEWGAKSELQPVGDFATRHPQFRAAVVIDANGPVVVRQRLKGRVAPQERSGLKFSHAAHLAEKGIKHPTKGTIRLVCGDCHRLEPGGEGMLPIRMERHCRACHVLTFDPSAPDREVPHGKPREVSAMLFDFYANKALQQRLQDRRSRPGERQLPGSQARLSREESEAALDWARQRAREVVAETIGKRACNTCHTVTPPIGDGEPWIIAPVWLADRWLPHSKFNHAKHKLVPCGDCHAASRSKSPQDVLLPGVGVCQDCHGGEAAVDKVPSTCIFCHDFHHHGLPPLRGQSARRS